MKKYFNNRACLTFKVRTALMLLFILMSTSAVWAQFGGGSGTASSPYLISTTAHMEQLAADVNDGNEYNGTYFKMTQDIDYAGGNHTPIGCDTGSAWHNFCGHFDGDGHSILNVKIDGNIYVALFGRASSGSIKNLTMGGNSLVTGKNRVAGIVGQGLALNIINCHVTKDVTIRANGFQTSVAVGSIVGCLDGGSYRINNRYISNCTNAATIEFKGTYGAQYMGGIIGYTRNTMGTTIQNCYNVGAVNPVGVGGTEANCQYVGGIVGWIEDGDGIWFKDNYCGGNCTRRAVGQEGTINATNISGQADRMSRIRVISKITADISTAPTVSIDGSEYYANGKKVDMTLTYNIALQEGEIMRYAAEQGMLTPNGTGYTLTVNGNDALIKTSTDVSYRDIGYTTWVSVSIPSQEYTGGALTPEVTVTDTKSGSPIVLEEGIDYEVLMPDGGCIRPGDYTIIIKGKGNFAGQQTATFTITSPMGTWAGSGTATDPYLILTLDDLNLLASRVNEGINYKDTHFKLMDNIDNDGKVFTPIGGQDRPFQGTFNGSFYTLSNLSIYLNGYSGVFGYIGQYGKVEYLNVRNCEINMVSSYAGIIAGRNDGVINSCNSINSEIFSKALSGSFIYLGGIAGYMGTGSISNCTNGTQLSIFFANYCGGIVGYNESGTIEGCFNSRYVNGNDYVGGMAGYNGGIVMGCINEDKVGGKSERGGIVGTNANSGKVEYCLSLRALTSANQSTYSGSVIGKDLGTATNNYYNFDNDNNSSIDKTIGGINGSDEKGKAMRGWIVDSEEGIHYDLFPDDDGNFTGITYDGIRYLGAGESSLIHISRGYEFSDYEVTVSAGSLTFVSEEDGLRLYRLTMPTTGQNIVIRLATTPTLNLADNDAKEIWKNERLIDEHEGFSGKVCLQGRTLYKDGAWNTICLPFDLTLAGSVLDGDGVEARTVAHADISGTTLNLTFGDPVTTLEAGEPYIIKWDATGIDIVSPVFSNVTIRDILSYYDNGMENGSNRVRFIGTYNTILFNDNNKDGVLLLGNDNNLHYVKAGAGLGGMRAYFLVGNDEQAQARRLTTFNIDFGDETTAIINTQTVNQAGTDAWHTLDGRRLQKQPTQRGIYIRNGRKIIIK